MINENDGYVFFFLISEKHLSIQLKKICVGPKNLSFLKYMEHVQIISNQIMGGCIFGFTARQITMNFLGGTSNCEIYWNILKGIKSQLLCVCPLLLTNELERALVSMNRLK